MKNKFAKIALIVIALISSVYFFAIDSVIKAIVEREGSNALHAKLDVANATFHLLPASLTLRGVQATNPQQPMSNLLQADVVALPLQLGELLDRKLIVDEMQIHGLRFAQPRQHSGAIEGLTPPPVEAKSDNAIADAEQLQQQKAEQQRSDLQRSQQDLIALRNDWQQRLRALPTNEQLNDYRFRAQSRDAGNRSRLRSELNDELATVRKLEEQFALDFERVKPELNYSALPQSGTVQLATGAPISITGGLLGREFKPLLAHLLGFTVSAQNSEASDSWQLLAHSIALDGEINLGANPLRFTGVVENVTPQPKLFDVVTRFKLENAPAQSGTFSATGSLDNRKLPLQNMRFNLTAFPVQQLPLSTDATLQITINKANADIQGLLALTGNQIDINVLARFQNAELQVVPGDTPIARTAAETLRGVNDFDLNFQASGDVNNPSLKLNSSLDTLLANAINRELNAQMASNGNSAQTALSPELTAMRQLAAELRQMQQTLLATHAALQNLLDL